MRSSINLFRAHYPHSSAFYDRRRVARHSFTERRAGDGARDLALLMWWMRRRRPAAGGGGGYWLVMERAEALVCLQHPGFVMDPRALADIAACYCLFFSRLTLAEASLS